MLVQSQMRKRARSAFLSLRRGAIVGESPAFQRTGNDHVSRRKIFDLKRMRRRADL